MHTSEMLVPRVVQRRRERIAVRSATLVKLGRPSPSDGLRRKAEYRAQQAKSLNAYKRTQPHVDMLSEHAITEETHEN